MADTPDKSLRGKSMMPTLTVDDLSQSLTFFRGLGFEIEDRWEDNGALTLDERDPGDDHHGPEHEGARCFLAIAIHHAVRERTRLAGVDGLPPKEDKRAENKI